MGRFALRPSNRDGRLFFRLRKKPNEEITKKIPTCKTESVKQQLKNYTDGKITNRNITAKAKKISSESQPRRKSQEKYLKIFFPAINPSQRFKPSQPQGFQH